MENVGAQDGMMAASRSEYKVPRAESADVLENPTVEIDSIKFHVPSFRAATKSY